MEGKWGSVKDDAVFKEEEVLCLLFLDEDD